MILISHRGNLEGKNPEKENSPIYVLQALSKGFDVEVDVWYLEGKWFLGHDEPQYETDLDFLKASSHSLWCHAKNIPALKMMLKEDIHCFWHQDDDVTLTSRGYIWTYPGKNLTEKSICVFPEQFEEIYNKSMGIDNCYGICSDYIVWEGLLWMENKGKN